MPQMIKVSAQFQKPLVFADFDKKSVRKGMNKIGAEVRSIARKLVSAKGLSSPGGFPGKATGVLRGSIDRKVSKSGFSVGISHYTKGKKASAVFEKKGFYPAYVYYGHVGPNRAAKDKNGKRTHKKNTSGKKVAQPRKNYIEEAVKQYSATKFPAAIRQVLDNALVPGPIRSKFK